MANMFDSTYELAKAFQEIPTAGGLNTEVLKLQIKRLVDLFIATAMDRASAGHNGIIYDTAQLAEIAPLVDLQVFADDLSSKGYEVRYDSTDPDFVICWGENGMDYDFDYDEWFCELDLDKIFDEDVSGDEIK